MAVGIDTELRRPLIRLLDANSWESPSITRFIEASPSEEDVKCEVFVQTYVSGKDLLYEKDKQKWGEVKVKVSKQVGVSHVTVLNKVA